MRREWERENVSYEGLCGGASTFANQAFALFVLFFFFFALFFDSGEMMRRASTIEKVGYSSCMHQESTLIFHLHTRVILDTLDI